MHGKVMEILPGVLMYSITLENPFIGDTAKNKCVEIRRPPRSGCSIVAFEARPLDDVAFDNSAETPQAVSTFVQSVDPALRAADHLTAPRAPDPVSIPVRLFAMDEAAGMVIFRTVLLDRCTLAVKPQVDKRKQIDKFDGGSQLRVGAQQVATTLRQRLCRCQGRQKTNPKKYDQMHVGPSAFGNRTHVGQSCSYLQIASHSVAAGPLPTPAQEFRANRMNPVNGS